MFSLEHVDRVRTAEIERVARRLPAGARVLEIGAGTGKQAVELARRGFAVTAIEVPQSSYAGYRLYPIIDYDGRTIPADNSSMDVVFSSNVLEHVGDLRRMHGEIKRVLVPGGRCIHVLPTHVWRLWTTLSSYPDAAVYLATGLMQLWPRGWGREELRRLARTAHATTRGVVGRCLPRRHGERGNVISELWLLHPAWWRRHFERNGFTVVRDEPMGLFYTGNMVFGTRLDIAARTRLGRLLGSAAHLFELVPAGDFSIPKTSVPTQG